MFVRDAEYRVLSGPGLNIHQVHDRTLMLADNRGVRSASEVADRGGMPMVAARQPGGLVHALLHHRPITSVADNEGVQVELKSVGDRIVIHAGSEAAGAHETSPFSGTRSATARSSSGVLREWRPRPPH